MKVLIINGNREQTPQTLIPVGACGIGSAAHAAGYETHFLDLTFSHRPVSAVRATIQRLQPDIIGLSIRNLDNCDAVTPHSYLPEMRALADTCRRFSPALLVLGGAAVSLAPAPILRYLGGDYAVIGEGERAFIALLHAIERRDDPARLPGILANRDAESADLTGAPLENALCSLPDVDFTQWLSLRRYRTADAAYPIQTKRGCRFQCGYCRYPYLEGHQWRLRDPAWVAEEAARATASGLRVIEFIDSVFGLPTAHAIACCEAIQRLPGANALSAMELNPCACVPELMHAMNAAGFSSIAVTAESGSDAMLAQMEKGFNRLDLERAARVLQALQAQKLWIFLIGAPGECEVTVRETAQFIAALPHTDLVYVAFGVRILPGTALRQTLVARGELDADNELLWPAFYHSPDIDPLRARNILLDSGFPAVRFVSLHDSVHRLLPVVQRVMARLGISPPYWRHLPWLNRARRLLHV